MNKPFCHFDVRSPAMPKRCGRLTNCSCRLGHGHTGAVEDFFRAARIVDGFCAGMCGGSLIVCVN